MDITWHGHSCFTVKGQDATVVLDPYSGLGTELPKLKGNILMLGDEYAENMGGIAPVEGEPKVLDWPGEFEVSNVTVESLGAHHFAKGGDAESGDHVNIFVFKLDGIKVCHLSGLGHELSDELLEHIGDVDILLLPIGGNDVVLDAKTAQKMVEAIDPRLVIPMYYAATETKMNLNGAADFLKAVGKSNLAPEVKFSVKGRSSLPETNMEYVLLEPQLKG